MSGFIASKFDPENDPDRPKIGEIVEDEDGPLVVAEVDWLSLRHVVEGGEEPDSRGYDKLLTRAHSTRPAVIWLAFCRRVTDEQRENLIHMLGVGNHIAKSQRGYRNYFCAGIGCTDEAQMMEMERLGLVRRGHKINDGQDVFYHATEAGMDAIGMTPAQKKRAMED